MYCNTRQTAGGLCAGFAWWYSWINHSECRLVYTRGIHENKNNEVRLSMPTYSYPEGWIQVVRSNLPPHLKRSLHSSHIPSSSQIIPNSLKHFSGASTSVVKEQGRIRRVWGYYSIMWPGLLRLPAGSGSRYRLLLEWLPVLCMVTSSQPRTSSTGWEQTQSEAVTSFSSSSSCSSPLWKTKAFVHIGSSHRPSLGHTDTVTLCMSWQSAYINSIKINKVRAFFSCKIFATF